MSTEMTALLTLYRDRVHRLARAWLPDEQEAAEIAQEALVRAWRNQDRYDQGQPFYPWLRTITQNACRDALARGRHRAAPGLDSERLQSLGPSPLERLSAREAEEAVKAALLTLPEPAREILIMRHYEDLSYAEIAESLGVPEGTVMSRLFRARRALTAALRGQDLGADHDQP